VSTHKQDQLREEAKELQKYILEKNEEVEDRNVSAGFAEVSRR